MESWTEIRAWRRETRAALIERRLALRRDERHAARDAVAAGLRRHVPELEQAAIGFYWPFRGEIDLRGIVTEMMALGATAALPAVVEKARPLEFRAWHPGIALERGVWDIPVPAPRTVVQPTVLLVALLGFDGAGYRLGYGGGYYDRTLAAMPVRPLTIGVGHALGRLATIHPQPHDVPLDAILTSEGIVWHRYRGATLGRTVGEVADPASPACSLHEADAAWRGWLDDAAVAALLGGLLARSGAAARGAGRTAQDATDPALEALLRDLSRARARHAALLTRHLARRGGPTDPAPDPWLDTLLAAAGPGARLALIEAELAETSARLRAALREIGDDALHADLAATADELAATAVRAAALRPPG